jgi:RNA polymerase sigma-70 factor (ECF subfamily)
VEDFTRLVGPHIQAMRQVASALVGLAYGEDATQEALTRAWKAWSTLREPALVRPWLLRITVNVCQHWRSTRGRQLTRELPLPTGDLAEANLSAFATINSDPGSSDHTGALDLRRALNHLPVDFRTVIVLRFYAGMEASDIAVGLVIAPATVRTRLHRGLQMLRERLLAAGITPPSAYFTERDPS